MGVAPGLKPRTQNQPILILKVIVLVAEQIPLLISSHIKTKKLFYSLSLFPPPSPLSLCLSFFLFVCLYCLYLSLIPC